MMRILTSEQIKAVEAAADESGISYLRLMENAGSACAKAIRTRFDPTDKRRVVALCGKGKNGGDGFVAARKLFENGYDVHVLLVAGEPKADNAREMFARLQELEVPAEPYMPQSERQRALLQKADILIDAVFGTGFAGSLPENLQALFAFAETCGGFVVSIDLPSGVCADTPQLQSRPLKADLTVSVMALKPALVSFPAREFAGEIQVVSIGIPDELYKAYNKAFAFSDKDIAALFPKRAADANKGDFGKALVIAGSYEMPGAALLACGACVECGAGLVRLAFPEQAYAAVTAAVPEKVLLPLASNRFGRISAQEEKRLLDALSNATACLVGCGLGLDYDTKAIVRAVLQNAGVPVVLDADGINAVCDDIDMIREAKAPVILTPHPGEAARLLGCTAREIQADRMGACATLCEKTGATVVLKGAGTVISADGKRFSVNMTGNAGMATAGSGDVLAGMLLGFLCLGLSPLEAAVAAAHIHGLAGDAVAAQSAMCSVTPSKMLYALPSVLSRFDL